MNVMLPLCVCVGGGHNISAFWNCITGNLISMRAGGDSPALMEPLQDQTVVSPASAKFTATIRAGEPRAELKWFKAGKAITVDGQKYAATYEGDQATLTVDKCELADAAEYSFTATNKVGSVSSKATLTVHGR